MQLIRSLLFGALCFVLPAYPATVLVVPFHNDSQYSDLDWVGESVAETLISEFRAANEIVLDRASREAAMQRLSLRSGAQFTKATLIKLGQTLDADYMCYGAYDASLPAGDSQLKSSAIQLTARFLDLRKMHEGPGLAEAGKLSELSRLKEHLAWESLKYLKPGANFPLEQFMSPRKFIRLDAEESYVRGLMSPSQEQKQKWFVQALALDPQFTSPAFELGNLAVARKDYRQAIQWFGHLVPSDPRYAEARFEMGLSAYGADDFSAAVNYFREVARTLPLNEVYNDLGAAEDRLGMPAAIEDFRRALEGDSNDPAYLFNLGLALMKHNYFAEAAQRFQQVIDRDPDDAEAHELLNRAQRHEAEPPPGESIPLVRLKGNLDATAFRQLKAMLQSKSAQ